MRPGPGNSGDDFLFDAVRAHARRLYGPSVRPLRVAYWIEGIPDPVSLPLAPWQANGSPAQQPFVPTQFQQDILDALAGKGLRTDALASATGGDQRRLFRNPGGLKELQEQGLVAHHKRVGYYRPDAPPEELADDGDE